MNKPHTAENGTYAPNVDDITVIPGDRNEGYVYVVRFDSGTVKVGHGINPRARVRSHASQAKFHGVTVTACWISTPHHRSLLSEADLIAWCANRGTPAYGREWFNGIAFDEAVEFASSLPGKQRLSGPMSDSPDAIINAVKKLWSTRNPSEVAQDMQVVENFRTASDEELESFRHYRARQAWRHRTSVSAQARRDEKEFLAVVGIVVKPDADQFSPRRRPKRSLTLRASRCAPIVE